MHAAVDAWLADWPVPRRRLLQRGLRILERSRPQELSAQPARRALANEALRRARDATTALAFEASTGERACTAMLHSDVVAMLDARQQDVLRAIDQLSVALRVVSSVAHPGHERYQSGFGQLISALLAAGASADEPCASAAEAPLLAGDGDGAPSDTPLVRAARRGLARVARLLLAAGATVDRVKEAGGTALLVASQEGHADVAAALLEAGAAVDRTNLKGATPLFMAAQNGHAAAADLLIRTRASIDLCRRDGCSPLCLASQEGHVAVVSLLLGGGADVDRAGEDGFSPLYAACANNRAPVIELLLEAGAAIDQPRTNGATPLLVACARGYATAAALLLEHGALVDQQMDGGFTPLLIACHQGNLSCVKLVSSYGASRSITTCPHHARPVRVRTADKIAARRGHASIARWLLISQRWCSPLHHLHTVTPARAKALLRAGADLHASTGPTQQHGPFGETPLALARAAANTPYGLFMLFGAGRETTVALVVRAAEPWSPATHELFPAAARARAVALVRLGYLLAADDRFAAGPGRAYSGGALIDVWRGCVLPRAIERSGRSGWSNGW